MNVFDLSSQNQNMLDSHSGEEDLLFGHSYSQTQRFFIHRLMYLLDLRRKSEATEDWKLHLLDMAIYSTFVDCLELEVGDDARALLHKQEATKQG